MGPHYVELVFDRKEMAYNKISPKFKIKFQKFLPVFCYFFKIYLLASTQVGTEQTTITSDHDKHQ